MSASQRFEDRLLAQLRRVVAEREDSREPTHSRGGRRRLVLSGASAALVIAIVAIVPIAIGTGDRTTDAYAIQVRPDGKVAVSIYRLGDASALQRSLRAAGVPAVVDFEATKAGPCVVAAAMNSNPEKAGGGDEASETRHLVRSESRIPRGTAPGAGEAGENATIQVHTVTAKGATNVTVSRFVVDPSRIGPHEKLYIVHSGTSILVREVSAVSCPTPPSSR
jgi:hypothetical protein